MVGIIRDREEDIPKRRRRQISRFFGGNFRFPGKGIRERRPLTYYIKQNAEKLIYQLTCVCTCPKYSYIYFINSKCKLIVDSRDFMTKTDGKECIALLEPRKCEGFDRIPLCMIYNALEIGTV